MLPTSSKARPPYSLTTLYAYRLLDKLSKQWRGLDRFFDGKQDEVLDHLVGRVRSLPLPTWSRERKNRTKFYSEGWGDFTVPAKFYAWLERYAREKREAENNLSKRHEISFLPRRISPVLLDPKSPNGVPIEEDALKAEELLARSEPETKYTWRANLSEARTLRRERLLLQPFLRFSSSDALWIREGIFETPALEIKDEMLPKESQTSRVLIVSPASRRAMGGSACILLAGTGVCVVITGLLLGVCAS